MICRLCVNTCSAFKSFYDEHGHENELYQKTLEYFHPKIVDMEKSKHLKGICVQCFEHIYEFNSFQSSVRVAQMKLIFSTEDKQTPVLITDDEDAPAKEICEGEQRSLKSYGPDIDLTADPHGWYVNVPTEVKTEKDLDYENLLGRQHSQGEPPDNRSLSTEPRNFHLEEDISAYEYPNETAVFCDDDDEDYDNDEDSKMNLTLPDLDIMDINADSEFILDDNGHFAKRRSQKKKPLDFKCTLCDKCYESPNDLRGHIITQHPENHHQWTCQLCDKHFNLKKGLEVHISLVHNVNPKTSINQANAFTLSNSQTENEAYACKLCDKQFNLKKGFELHNSLVHATEPVSKPSIIYRENIHHFKTEMFEDSYETPDALGFVIKDMDEQTQICISPSELEIMDIDPFQHTGDQHRFTCHICEKGFNLEKALALHYTLAHRTEPQSKPQTTITIKIEDDVETDAYGGPLQSHMINQQYTCKLCDKVYNFEKGLEIHNSLVHGFVTKPRNVGKKPMEPKHSKNPHKISKTNFKLGLK